MHYAQDPTGIVYLSYKVRIQMGQNQHKRELIKDVTQTQQQRPESPTVTLTWHACIHRVHNLHLRYILIWVI